MLNRVSFLLAIAVVVNSNAAWALSPADPAPEIFGTIRGSITYTILGVVDDSSQATVVSCTCANKTGGADCNWGVEFVEVTTVQNNIGASQGTWGSAPGSTANVATRSVPGWSTLQAITPAPGIARGRGWARVISDSRVICSAFLVDVTTGDHIVPLPVLKKTQQSGM